MAESLACRKPLGIPNLHPGLEATAVVGDNEKNWVSVGRTLDRLDAGTNSLGIRLSTLFFAWDGIGKGRRLRIRRQIP